MPTTNSRTTLHHDAYLEREVAKADASLIMDALPARCQCAETSGRTHSGRWPWREADDAGHLVEWQCLVCGRSVYVRKPVGKRGRMNRRDG